MFSCALSMPMLHRNFIIQKAVIDFLSEITELNSPSQAGQLFVRLTSGNRDVLKRRWFMGRSIIVEGDVHSLVISALSRFIRFIIKSCGRTNTNRHLRVILYCITVQMLENSFCLPCCKHMEQSTSRKYTRFSSLNSFKLPLSSVILVASF